MWVHSVSHSYSTHTARVTQPACATHAAYVTQLAYCVCVTQLAYVLHMLCATQPACVLSKVRPARILVFEICQPRLWTLLVEVSEFWFTLFSVNCCSCLWWKFSNCSACISTVDTKRYTVYKSQGRNTCIWRYVIDKPDRIDWSSVRTAIAPVFCPTRWSWKIYWKPEKRCHWLHGMLFMSLLFLQVAPTLAFIVTSGWEM